MHGIKDFTLGLAFLRIASVASHLIPEIWGCSFSAFPPRILWFLFDLIGFFLFDSSSASAQQSSHQAHLIRLSGPAVALMVFGLGLIWCCVGSKVSFFGSCFPAAL